MEVITILEWKVMTGDEKLEKEIQRCKETFDSWFNNYWASRCSREKMLSPESPIEHVYYKMCKTFDEVKEKYPLSAKEECSSCGERIDRWLETSFSFCNEYGCGMVLCEKCAKDLANKINKM